MKFLGMAAFGFAITLAVVASAFAQKSELTGTVYDANGAVVVGAKISALSSDGKKFETVSNDRGVYILSLPFNKYDASRGFKESRYDIYVESVGFRRSETKGYVFIPSQFGKMNLDIGLEISPGVDEFQICGYAGECAQEEEIKIEKIEPLDNITPRPNLENVGKTRFCMTVTDAFGAFIPKSSVRFTPTKQSRSRLKYEFMTDAEGTIDVTIVVGSYDISVKASTYKKTVLKNQLLPYDPRSCITVKLKTAIPPHQIT